MTSYESKVEMTFFVSAKKKRTAWRNSPYWMILPAVLLLLLLIGIPFFISLYFSFTALDQYTIAHWASAPIVGLRNYVEAFSRTTFVGAPPLQSAVVSCGFSLLTTIIITPIGITAALIANIPFRGRRWIRTIFLLPYAVPVFVNAIIWRMLFMNGWGLVDRVLAQLHLASVNTYWLIGPHSFWAMVIADVWASWPFVYLMVLAGLQGIPKDWYESAYIDGASPIRCFFSITLPAIRPVLFIALLLSTLNHFNNFTLPYVMFGTPPSPQAEVLPLNVYITSFQNFSFGLGSAVSILTLVLMMIPVVFYIHMLRLGEDTTR
ncbi:carbohydrate ABC transporter permease [Alicyclobacillus macrosporangiidus]|uniref:carbohydrate ABC transporter permease n=1 Tax=Alicyclobacillus macrosporangiidus TaxID=392015 RepID=UPI00068FDBF5|nr:sugar ABC transporter permease [Alicyclobacillus macrosporangiidus]